MKNEKNLTPFAVLTPHILDTKLSKSGGVLYVPLGTPVSTDVRWSSQHEKRKEFSAICSFNPSYSRYHAFQERGCIICTTWHSRKYRCTLSMLPLNNRQPSDSFVCSQCNFKAPASQPRHAHSFLIQFAINSQSIDSNSVYRVVWESGPA